MSSTPEQAAPARTVSVTSLRIARAIDPAAAQSMAIWHVAVDRERRGPISATDVERLIHDGALHSRSYCWRAGMASWAFLETIVEFQTALRDRESQSARTIMSEAPPSMMETPSFDAPTSLPEASSTVESPSGASQTSPVPRAAAMTMELTAIDLSDLADVGAPTEFVLPKAVSTATAKPETATAKPETATAKPEPAATAEPAPVAQLEPATIADPEPPPVVEPETTPVAELKAAPVAEAEPPPVAEAEPPPVAEPEPIPVAEPEPTRVPEPAPTPVVEPEPTPVAEPEPTPVVEPEPTPVVEPEPTPVAEPAPTPVVEPVPTPVVEPVPTPVVEPVPTHVVEPEAVSAPEPTIGAAPATAEAAPKDALDDEEILERLTRPSAPSNAPAAPPSADLAPAADDADEGEMTIQMAMPSMTDLGPVATSANAESLPDVEAADGTAVTRGAELAAGVAAADAAPVEPSVAELTAVTSAVCDTAPPQASLAPEPAKAEPANSDPSSWAKHLGQLASIVAAGDSLSTAIPAGITRPPPAPPPLPVPKARPAASSAAAPPAIPVPNGSMAAPPPAPAAAPERPTADDDDHHSLAFFEAGENQRGTAGVEVLPDVEEPEPLFPDSPAPRRSMTQPRMITVPVIQLEERPPTPAEMKGLVQDFSLMIRLEKKKRTNTALVVGGLVLVGLAIAAVAYFALQAQIEPEKGADRLTVMQTTSNADDLIGALHRSDGQAQPAEKGPVSPVAVTNHDSTAVDLAAVLADNKAAVDARAAQAAIEAKETLTITIPGPKKPEHEPGVPRQPDSGGAAPIQARTDQVKEALKAPDLVGKVEQPLDIPSLAGTATRPTVSDPAVNELIQRSVKRFTSCKRAENPIRVRLTFTVAETGEVGSSTVTLPDGEADLGLSTCIRKLVSSWKFPQGDKPQTFNKTIVL